jgi:hypothetical protein
LPFNYSVYNGIKGENNMEKILVLGIVFVIGLSALIAYSALVVASHHDETPYERE